MLAADLMDAVSVVVTVRACAVCERRQAAPAALDIDHRMMRCEVDGEEDEE